MRNTTTARKAQSAAAEKSAQARDMIIEHYWQVAHDRRPFTMVKHGDVASIDFGGGFFSFGSIAGYALENYEDPVEALNTAATRREAIVWLNALPVIIDCSGKTGAQKAMEHRQPGAKLHALSIGSIVWLEGQTYRIDKDFNRNVKLTAVRVAYPSGTVTEGRLH